MTYQGFKLMARRWTLAQLRCDEPPTEELLAFIARLGEDYEPYVQRYEREAARDAVTVGALTFKRDSRVDLLGEAKFAVYVNGEPLIEHGEHVKHKAKSAGHAARIHAQLNRA